MSNETGELTYQIIMKVRAECSGGCISPHGDSEKKESWLFMLYLTNREDYSMEFDKKPSIEWCGEGGSLSLQIKCDDFSAAFKHDHVIGFSLSKE